MGENDLKWVANETNNNIVNIKQFYENVCSKTPSFKLSHFAEMQNDTFIHREGLKRIQAQWDN